MDLNIDFKSINSVSTEIGSLQEEFQNLLNDINQINTDLKSSWAGDDANEYTKAIDEQSEYMRQLSNTILEIHEFLISVQKAYEQVSDDNISAI